MTAKVLLSGEVPDTHIKILLTEFHAECSQMALHIDLTPQSSLPKIFISVSVAYQ